MRSWMVALMGMAVCIIVGFSPARAQEHDDAADKGQPSSHHSKSGKKEDKEAKPAYTGIKKRLAVAPIPSSYSSTVTSDGYIPLPSNFGASLTEMLTTELFNSGRFLLVERKALDDILTEQRLGSSGLVSSKTAPEIGKLTGAQMLVTASITEFSFDKGGGGVTIGGVHVGGSKGKATLKLDMRLIDATTGEIAAVTSAEGNESAGGGFNVDTPNWSVGSKEFTNSSLGKATRKAIQNAVKFICDKMEPLPWEGMVADLDTEGSKTTALYVKGGSDVGLKEGDELEILQPGDAILDPETGQSLGRKPDKHIGRCRIQTVSEKLSTATPIEGDGFKKAQIVRMADKGHS